MVIREAVAADFEPLVSLARNFTRESGLPFTFNEVRARETIWSHIHYPEVDFIVETDEDVLTGCAVVTYDADYYNETCAYVEKLFVHKEFRGRGTSDNIIRGILGFAEKRDARVVFASATAGMGERIEKLYVRLFERHGFNVLGRIIMRKI